MASDLKRMLDGDDGPPTAPIPWSEADASRAIEQMWLRVGELQPRGFQFWAEDRAVLEVIEMAIGRGWGEQDLEGLRGAINAYEREIAAIVKRHRQWLEDTEWVEHCFGESEDLSAGEKKRPH